MGDSRELVLERKYARSLVCQASAGTRRGRSLDGRLRRLPAQIDSDEEEDRDHRRGDEVDHEAERRPPPRVRERRECVLPDGRGIGLRLSRVVRYDPCGGSTEGGASWWGSDQIV